MNNPKFEQKIKQKVLMPASNQATTSGYGIILSYDAQANTATVQMTTKNGFTTGQIYPNVACPTTIGVQGVAPSPGRPCFVDFHGDKSDYFPVIINLFNPYYNTIDYDNQSASVNNTPRYILGT